MKKLIFTSILTLLGVMALTSCVERPKEGDQLTTMLTIESSQDLIDVCDIEVTYKGKGGVNKIDTITETEWHKIIINDSFPTKIGVITLRYLVKPGFKPTKDKYNLLCNYTLITKEMERERNQPFLRLFDVPADKVADFLDLKNYLNKDLVRNEADSISYYGEVITVFKAKEEVGFDPFIFDDEKPTAPLVDDGTDEYPEEITDNPDTTDIN